MVPKHYKCYIFSISANETIDQNNNTLSNIIIQTDDSSWFENLLGLPSEIMFNMTNNEFHIYNGLVSVYKFIFENLILFESFEECVRTLKRKQYSSYRSRMIYFTGHSLFCTVKCKLGFI